MAKAQVIIYSLLTGCLFWGVIYVLYQLQKWLATWIGRKYLNETDPSRAFCEGSRVITSAMLKMLAATYMLATTFIIGAWILLAIFK